MCGCSHMPLIGDLTCSPGMCPDWESNWRPFDLQTGAQSTEPHQPGLYLLGFVARSYGGLSSWHQNPGIGACCGAGTPHSQDIPPKFLSTPLGCGTSWFRVSTSLPLLPVWMDVVSLTP